MSGDGDAQEFYFLEMNTRLQVEHRVTEQITGSNLVRWQLLVAQGQEFNVEQDDLEVDGHSIEVRLYAEDPANNFLPSVGRLDQFTLPADYTALVDSGYATGDEVSRYYDPMLAKIVTHGDDREEATREMVAALQEVAVKGVSTNRDMLLAILSSFPFFAGDTTTAFLEEHPGLLDPDPGDTLPAAPILIAAAFRHLDDAVASGDWSTDPFRGALVADPVPARLPQRPRHPRLRRTQLGQADPGSAGLAALRRARASRDRVLGGVRHPRRRPLQRHRDHRPGRGPGVTCPTSPIRVPTRCSPAMPCWSNSTEWCRGTRRSSTRWVASW